MGEYSAVIIHIAKHLDSASLLLVWKRVILCLTHVHVFVHDFNSHMHACHLHGLTLMDMYSAVIIVCSHVHVPCMCDIHGHVTFPGRN